jgi:hypothetical protein
MNAFDLDQLHQAIIASLTAGFPDIPNVFDYLEKPQSTLKKPALTVQLTDMEMLPDQDSGDQQLPVKASFTAYLVLDPHEPHAERTIRKRASDLALFIQGQRWGLTGICPAAITGLSVDQFEPDLDRALVWSIDFTQEFHLGKSVWDDDQFPAAMAKQLAKHTNQPICAAPNNPDDPNSDWQALPPPTSIQIKGEEA